jgi:hypothetical protein
MCIHLAAAIYAGAAGQTGLLPPSRLPVAAGSFPFNSE